ncbi:MAG: hypothetical protein ACYDCL_09820 [Myxococcales bacterium]
MRGSLWLLLAMSLSCASLIRGGGSQDDAEHQVDLFCRALHWKDFEAASLLFVPEQRSAWRRARDQAHDERDLSVTSCDVREVRLNSTSTGAQAFVKMSWFRLPDSIEKTEEVEQRWEWRSGRWLLVRMVGGPLE